MKHVAWSYILGVCHGPCAPNELIGCTDQYAYDFSEANDTHFTLHHYNSSYPHCSGDPTWEEVWEFGKCYDVDGFPAMTTHETRRTYGFGIHGEPGYCSAEMKSSAMNALDMCTTDNEFGCSHEVKCAGVGNLVKFSYSRHDCTGSFITKTLAIGDCVDEFWWGNVTLTNVSVCDDFVTTSPPPVTTTPADTSAPPPTSSTAAWSTLSPGLLAASLLVLVSVK